MPNVREVAKCCVLSMIRVSGQSKSRPVKAAGAESCGQRRNQKLHAAVAKSRFWSEIVQNTSASEHFLKFWCRKIARRFGEKQILKWKCTKTRQVRSTFWSSDVEKLHAAVARRAFTSQNVKILPVSEHFLTFRCRKIARPCGEKRMCKSKCANHLRFGALFEVQMSKN